MKGRGGEEREEEGRGGEGREERREEGRGTKGRGGRRGREPRRRKGRRGDKGQERREERRGGEGRITSKVEGLSNSSKPFPFFLVNIRLPICLLFSSICSFS